MKIKVSENEKEELIKIKELISSDQLEVRKIGKNMLKKYRRFYKYIWFVTYNVNGHGEYDVQDHSVINKEWLSYYVESFSESLAELDNIWSRGQVLRAFIDAVVSDKDVFYMK